MLSYILPPEDACSANETHLEGAACSIEACWQEDQLSLRQSLLRSTRAPAAELTCAHMGTCRVAC